MFASTSYYHKAFIPNVRTDGREMLFLSRKILFCFITVANDTGFLQFLAVDIVYAHLFD